MKAVEMYEVNDEVMVRAIVSNVYIKDGDVWYELRDPMTNNTCFSHSFSPDMLMPCDELLIPKDKEKVLKVKGESVVNESH